MKKIIITILVALLYTSAFSQKRVSLGLKGGSGFRSWQAGFLGEVKIAGILFVQPEVLYAVSTKKSYITVQDANGWAIANETVFFRTSSVMVPVQLKLKFGKIVRPYYMLGWAPAFRIDSYARPQNKDYDIKFAYQNYGNYQIILAPEGVFERQKRADISRVTNTFRNSIVSTFGVEFSIKKIAPFAEMRGIYYLGQNHFEPQIDLLLTTGIKF